MRVWHAYKTFSAVKAYTVAVLMWPLTKYLLFLPGESEIMLCLESLKSAAIEQIIIHEFPFKIFVSK